MEIWKRQIIAKMTRWVNWEESPGRDRHHYQAKAKEGGAALEVIGSFDRVEKASLAVTVPSDAPALLDRNMGMLYAFHNLFHDDENWLLGAIEKQSEQWKKFVAVSDKELQTFELKPTCLKTSTYRASLYLYRGLLTLTFADASSKRPKRIGFSGKSIGFS